MKIVGSLTPTRIAKGDTPLPAWFNLMALPRVSTAAAIDSEITIDDAVYGRSTPANVLREVDIATTSIHPAFQSFTFSSSNEGVLTVSQNGRVSRVSDGTATITVTSDGVSRSVEAPVSFQGEDSVDIFMRFADGSVAKQVSDSVDAMISGKTSSVAKPVFTTQNHATQTYVRNPNLWCASLAQKLTCCSPWNSDYGNKKAGTLITPRHIFFASHYKIAEGATVRFVTLDGTVINRTMVKRLSLPIPAGSWPYPDMTIGVLDGDLPASITPCKILPSDFADYLPSIAGTDSMNDRTFRVPALCLDQEEKATVFDLFLLGVAARFAVPVDANRLAFYEKPIPGDSGNPSFLVINGELVMVCVWTGGDSGHNPALKITDLNQLLVDADTLIGVSTVADPTWPNSGGHYQLKVADLSGSTKYT